MGATTPQGVAIHNGALYVCGAYGEIKRVKGAFVTETTGFWCNWAEDDFARLEEVDGDLFASSSHDTFRLEDDFCWKVMR